MAPVNPNYTPRLLWLALLMPGLLACALVPVALNSFPGVAAPLPLPMEMPDIAPSAAVRADPAQEGIAPLPAMPAMWVHKNVVYRTIQGVDPILLSLDIYTPSSRGPHPIMVMIHGGAWRTGDKESQSVSEIKSSFFTQQNFIFISVNYRLAPDDIHPAQVQDVASALSWIMENASTYGGDTGRLYLMGHSSGGHLAALIATDEHYLAGYGLSPRALRGVILLDAAGLDIPATMSPSSTFMYTTAFGFDPGVWVAASPVYHLVPGEKAPPFLVCVGGQIPEWQQTGQQFAIKLASLGLPVRLVLLTEKTHNTMAMDVGLPFDPLTGNILDFIRLTLASAQPDLSSWR